MTRLKKMKWAGSLVIALVIAPLVYAQSNAPVITPTPVTLTAKKMAPDDRGTDVENIYDFVVDFADQTRRTESYNVLLYLDGNYVTEYKNVTLPYKFSRNFKGQLDKTYEVRIDLENKDLRIVARQTVTINVQRHGQVEKKNQR